MPWQSRSGESESSKVKKDKDNVALAAISSAENLHTCWHCGKTGHVKAFCKEKPICGGETGEANIAFATTNDSNIWLDEVPLQSSNYEVWGGANCMFIFNFSLHWYSCVQGGVLKHGVYEHQKYQECFLIWYVDYLIIFVV